MVSNQQTQQETKLCQSYLEKGSRCTVQEEKNSKRNNLVFHRWRSKPPLYNDRKRGSSGAGPCFLSSQAESSSWGSPFPAELKQGCLPKQQDLIHRPQKPLPLSSTGTSTLSGDGCRDRRAGLGPCRGAAPRRRPPAHPVTCLAAAPAGISGPPGPSSRRDGRRTRSRKRPG